MEAFSFVLKITSNSQNTTSWEGRVWCGFESKKLLHIFFILVYKECWGC